MSNKVMMLLAILTGAVFAVSALAYDAHLAPLAYQGDVVMVGKIVELAEPAEMDFSEPGVNVRHVGKFQKMVVEVGEVLKDTTGKVKPLAKQKKTIVVVQEWPKTDKRDPARDTAPPATESDYLAKGNEYVMILHKVDGKDEFYLPNYHGNRDSVAWIDQYRVPADLNKWNWGKTVNGLQMAFFLRSEQIDITKSQPLPHVMVLFAIRNTTDNDVTISLEPRPLHIIATQGGTTLDPDLYDKIGKRSPDGQLIPVKQLTLKPGQVVFLNHLGKAVIETRYNMAMTEGEWSFKVAYDFVDQTQASTLPTSRPSKSTTKKSTSKGSRATLAKSAEQSPAKPEPASSSTKLWTGRIESEAIKLKVIWRGPK